MKSKGDEIDFSDTYLDFGEASTSSRVPISNKTTVRVLARKLADTDKILEKSVLVPGVEKLHTLPSYDEGRRQMLKKRKVCFVSD